MPVGALEIHEDRRLQAGQGREGYFREIADFG
jgi:hypothetical protein